MRVCSVVKIVNAPVAEVWAITSSFGAIATWISGVKRVAVAGAGIGAVRTVTLDQDQAQETMTVLDPANHSIRYAVSSPGIDSLLKGCIGGIDLSEAGPDRTRLEWAADAEAVTGDMAMFQAFLTQFYEESIANLARLLDTTVDDAS